MRMKKSISTFIFIVIGIAIFWYINFPAHEKLAEDRIDKYMAAQGIDKSKISSKKSLSNKQGRWEIFYTFEDEKNITYVYTYDKSQDRVIVFVRNQGIPIERGMKYPSLQDDYSWTEFDNKGNIILN